MLRLRMSRTRRSKRDALATALPRPGRAYLSPHMLRLFEAGQFRDRLQLLGVARDRIQE